MNLLQYSLFVISILVILYMVNYIINNNIKENFVNSFDDFEKTLSNFKYSKPKSLVRNNNKIPYLRLLQPLKDYYVQYYYEFRIPELNSEDSNFQILNKYSSRPNNFDKKKNN